MSETPAFLKDISSGAKLKETGAKKQEDSGVAQAKLLFSLRKTPTLNTAAKPEEGLSRSTYAAYIQDQKEKKTGKSFTESLDPESLERFNEVCTRKFSEQAQFFLNAFWDECGKFAEVIFTVLWEQIKGVDMHRKGLMYVHLYEEGKDLDFDMGLYLFEKVIKYFQEDKKGQEWAKQFPEAVPAMQTAIVRKKELRDSVDVNFDGRVSFLEFLLYQFKVSPKTLMDRSVAPMDPAFVKAQKALDDVTAQINAYEREKKRLEDESKGTGVKALKATNLLAQLTSSPLMENLRRLLITAEAAVRAAAKKAGPGGASTGGPRQDGSLWWMQRDLKVKQDKYGK